MDSEEKISSSRRRCSENEKAPIGESERAN